MAILLIITIGFLSVCGCSQNNSNIESSIKKSSVPDDCYFICNHKGDAGLILYTPDEEKNMHFGNSTVEHIVRSDGTFFYPNGTFMLLDGQIPKDSVLFISNDATHSVGVWDVAQYKWIVEPQGQSMAYHCDYGQMLDFSINDLTYNLDGSILDNTPHLFPVNDELSLQNVEYNGTSYIGNQNYDFFLDAADFYEKNKQLNILYGIPVGIELTQVLSNQYLFINYSYQMLQDDGTYKNSTCTYLCDINGNILFPEWDYQCVDFPQNQYGDVSRNILYFINYNTEEIHYLDLSTSEEVLPSVKYDAIVYKTNNLFLLKKGTQYSIYNSSTHKAGTPFNSTVASEKIKVLGINSYVISGLNHDTLIIDSHKYKQDTSSYKLDVKGSPYPVVNVVDPMGNIQKSYILTQNGQLFLKTNEYITYADEKYYCVYDNRKTFSHVNIYRY